MNTTRLAALALGGILGTLVPACDLDVPDLNDPLLDQLQDHPNGVLVGAACTGLLIGNRRNQAFENGYVTILGILGHEAYNFDAADPRYIGELLGGALSQGSPFGGNFWTLPYANIRLANVVLDSLDKVPGEDLNDAKKAAVRGFVHTIQALDLLEVIVTHDTNGAVIDTDQPIVRPPGIQPLGAIVDKDTTYKAIVGLLDSALPDLDAAITADTGFPFEFSSGYHNDPPKPTFDTPATFRKFNRAIRARVAAYTEDYPGVLLALGESFLDDSPTADLNLGVYYVYSTKTGDATNALINSNIYAHPKLEDDAQMTPDGKKDERFTRKVARALNKDGTINPGSANDTPLTSTIRYTGLYSSGSSPVALIRNDDLILLKAEALFFTAIKNGTPTDPATDELNIVRTRSGGLAPLPATADMATFVSELLYERRYSLMFEGGHRWIDVRRFHREATELAPEDPTYIINIRFPFPAAECNARPGEPRCMLGST
jgi:hypothetical protein